MQTVEVKIKIVVIGSNSVGKTSLLNACVSNKEVDYKPFENLSSMKVVINEDNAEYLLELWDTKSVDFYKILEEMHNDKFSVALICYSVIELKTFEDVRKKVKIVSHHLLFQLLKIKFFLYFFSGFQL